MPFMETCVPPQSDVHLEERPTNLWQLAEVAATLVRTGRTAEAEALLADGKTTFPDHPRLFIDHATLAETRSDWPEVIRRFTVVTERFPHEWWAYARIAIALCHLHRFDEADRVLEEGQEQVPGERALFIDYGTVAEARGDWPEAIRRFTVVKEKFPDNWWAYARIAIASRHLGRLDEADRILEEGQRQVPGERALFIDYGTVAEARADWPEAIRRFTVVKERFPDGWWAYARIAAALRQLGRLDEADRILEEGQRQVPDERALFIDYGTVAELREDWPEAIRRFTVVKERFPDGWWAYARIARALLRLDRFDEADLILEQGQAQAPGERALFIDHGAVAEARGDWPEVIRRLTVVKERFPDEWWVYARIGTALRELGRLDEADQILEQGQQRLPQEQALFIDHGTIAELRRDWPEAIRRFTVVTERFPGNWWAYARIAAALRELGRLDEADRVLEQGQARVPGERALFIDHAAIAEARADWPEAIRRFTVVKERFPDSWWAYARIAAALRRLDRIKDAERVLEEAQQRLPHETALFLDYAGLAESIWNWTEALKRFELVRERFPDNWWGYVGQSRTLVHLSRTGEAQSLLMEMLQLFPDEAQPLVDLAYLSGFLAADERQIPLDELDRLLVERADARGMTVDLLDARAQIVKLKGDYPQYLSQLKDISERFPDFAGIKEKIIVAEEILLGSAPVSYDTKPERDSKRRGNAEDQSIASILPQFESLGGGGSNNTAVYGCEFGFFQRQCGIEPLSLLRWSGVSLPSLTRALEAGFAGVGAPGSTVLKAKPNASDWAMVDTTYDIFCDHTHLERISVPEQQAHAMMCQRMSFLSRKLTEDLEDGDKIFVYRYAGPLPDEAELTRLAEAVNRFGPSLLFLVCRASGDDVPLGIRRIHDGLVVGFIDWFATDRPGCPWNIAGWTRLCQAAYAEWTSARGA